MIGGNYVRGKIVLNHNCSKIKCIKVLSKLYEVVKISFYDFSVEARETNLNIDDVSEDEIFDISSLADFKVRLVNGNGK